MRTHHIASYLTLATIFGAEQVLCKDAKKLPTCFTTMFDAVNTSGVVQFHPGDDLPAPWYMTMAMGDSLDKRLSPLTQHDLASFLSVPEELALSGKGNMTNVCFYQARAVNKTMNDDGSCDGILSDKCIRALKTIPPPSMGEDCPEVPDEIRDICDPWPNIHMSKLVFFLLPWDGGGGL